MIPQSFHSLYVCLGLLFITGCKLLFRVVLPSGTGKNIVHKKTSPTISVGRLGLLNFLLKGMQKTSKASYSYL